MLKTTVSVEGMMCGMCEAHVNDAIRKNFQVKKVSSSHKKGETVIISAQEIPQKEIENAIAESGYKVLSVQSEPYKKKGLFGFGK